VPARNGQREGFRVVRRADAIVTVAPLYEIDLIWSLLSRRL
jgi:hypothetical protein